MKRILVPLVIVFVFSGTTVSSRADVIYNGLSYANSGAGWWNPGNSVGGVISAASSTNSINTLSFGVSGSGSTSTVNAYIFDVSPGTDGNYNTSDDVVGNLLGTASGTFNLNVSGNYTINFTNPVAVGQNFVWSMMGSGSSSSLKAMSAAQTTNATPGTQTPAGAFWTYAYNYGSNLTGKTISQLRNVAPGSYTWAVSFNGTAGPPPGNYWAPDAGGGGSGTWSTNSSAWSTSSGSQGSAEQSDGSPLVFGGTAGTVTVSGEVSVGAGLEFATTGYSITGGTAVNLAGANTAANAITTDSGVGATISSVLTGTAGMKKAGNGTLTLSAANTYSGGTLVSAGRLVGTTTSLQGNITNNAELAFNQSTNGTYSGAMSGSGALVKSGSATVTLAGESSYGGGTLISEGALSGDTKSLQGSITNNGKVIFSVSTNGTHSGAISGSGSFTKGGGGTLTLSGANSYSGGTLVSAGQLNGDSRSLQGDITNNAAVYFVQNTNGTYSGSKSGSGSMIKSGTATLTLDGASTFSGTTTVSAGTMVVDGSLSSVTTVESGATLGGSGSVGGLIVNSGGTISPGNSPGTTTVTGNATWNPGGNYNWQIYNATGTAGAPNGWDLTDISGTLDLSALSLGNTFNINLWSLSGISPDADGAAINFDATTSLGTSWVIATAASGITGFTGTDQFSIYTSPNNGTAGFANPTAGSFFVTSDGTSLYLIYGVPEPGTYAAAALLTALGGYVRWRRRRQA